VHGLENTAPDGFQIRFSAGNTRRMLRLSKPVEPAELVLVVANLAGRETVQLISCFKLAMAQPSF
jgi:hypothetical protein